METNSLDQINDPGLIAKLIADLKAKQKALKSLRPNRDEKAKAAAKELELYSMNVRAAMEAYREKGFDVNIEVGDNGLIKKWSLKGKYPKRNLNGGGGAEVKSGPDIKTLRYEEFDTILGRLGDAEFGSKDIQSALIGSGIGARKLQPTLGNILKGMNGPSPIEKVPGTDKAGTRYRKVK